MKKNSVELEGWTFINELQPNGKVKKRYIYVGEYYEPQISHSHQIKLRVIYCALFLIAAVIYGFTAFQSTASNLKSIISVFSAFSLVSLIFVLYVLIFYVVSIGKMTVGDYKTLHKPLWRNSIITAGLMWFTALESLIFWFATKCSDWRSLLCVFGYAVPGVLLFIIFLLERKIEYIEIPNDKKLEESSDESSDKDTL